MKILDLLDEAEKKATAGPWHIGHVNENLDRAEIDAANGINILSECRRGDENLICYMRNNLRALIDVARAAKDVIGLACLYGQHAEQNCYECKLALALQKLKGEE